jgi:hypothetical protein
MNVPVKIGPRYHAQLIQGSDEWLQMRCGMLTASEMSLALTPTLKLANNDKLRAHVWEITAQRITNYVEPRYVGDKMLRGRDDEIEARRLYHKNYFPVTEVGFATNDDLGFTIGYSPDGLVGDDGLIEAKSRDQKFQVETIARNAVPQEHILQCQTGLFVTKRKWLDFLSYSGGLPMAVIRVEPVAEYQEAIREASIQFEQSVQECMAKYHATLATKRFIPTERRVDQEMYI